MSKPAAIDPEDAKMLVDEAEHWMAVLLARGCNGQITIELDIKDTRAARITGGCRYSSRVPQKTS